MISRKSTFFLGIFIFLLPFLGLPSSWKILLTALSGVFLIYLSIKITLPKNIVKTKIKKEKIIPIINNDISIYPENNTIEKFEKPKVKKSKKIVGERFDTDIV